MTCTAHVGNSTRMFNCGRCHRLVQICRSCDRGNRYCSPRCSDDARRESVRDAGRRYRQTEAARRKNAARQRRYRERRARQRREEGATDSPVTQRSRPALGQAPSRVQPDDRTQAALADTARTAPPHGARPPSARGSGQQRPSKRRPRPSRVSGSRPRCGVCRRACGPFTRRESLRSSRRVRRPAGLQRRVRRNRPVPRFRRQIAADSGRR